MCIEGVREKEKVLDDTDRGGGLSLPWPNIVASSPELCNKT